MRKVFVYKEVEYGSEQELREGIFQATNTALPVVEDDQEWLKYGVSVCCVEEEQEEIKRDLHVERQIKKMEVANAFDNVRSSSASCIMSSLGFEVNSNVNSYNNVTMLIDQVEDGGTVNFRTFANSVVPLNFEQLRIIRKELSNRNSELYAQKWNLEAKIEQACSVEELERIEVMFE